MTLDARLRAFHASRRALLADVEALDPALLVARPAAGKWSIVEIVEHLVRAERAILQELPEPSRVAAHERRLGHRLRYAIVYIVVKFGIPVEAPSAAMLPLGERTLAVLRRMWDENHEWLRAFIDRLDGDGARKAFFHHPVAGPLTVKQAMQLDQLHLDRHAGQIRRLNRLLAS
ncbi:MAG: hypothetical protein NVS1B4_12340 [Gemmatimonadaceae bacterium]